MDGFVSSQLEFREAPSYPPLKSHDRHASVHSAAARIRIGLAGRP
jgi:hypothetical protein